MADIAMLVAEEYERRVKNTRKAGGDSEAELLPLHVVSDWVSSMVQRLKPKVGAETRELQNYTKWVLEPRTQIGVAASNSFFSA